MENITQMQERHKKEIADLQDNCKHEKTKRMPFMWAIGHFGADVEVCDWCGKILQHYTDKQDFKDIDWNIKPK